MNKISSLRRLTRTLVWLPALSVGILFADGTSALKSGVYQPQPTVTTVDSGSAGAIPPVPPAIPATTQPQDAGERADAWPRKFTGDDGSTFTIYPPQLDSWDGFNFLGRSAIGVTQPNSKTTTYGVISVAAQTQTDRQGRTVDFEKITIVNVSFPSAPEASSAWFEQLRKHLPTSVNDISLDRLEAGLATVKASSAAAKDLRNDAPKIIFSTKPALPVLVDGKPQWHKIEGTSLERVVNTRAFLVRDVSKPDRVFLHFWDGYVESTSLEGSWSPAKDVSPAIKSAETALVAAKQVDLLGGQKNPDTGKTPSLASDKLPEIYVATEPTELLVTAGEPNWTPIAGTQLLFASNTVAHIFKETGDQKIYVLISGRWFSASELTSNSWKHIAGTSLPIDFQKIPDDSPQENVKAAVPGTTQAQEAVIANSIPQTTRVVRSEAKLQTPIVYDAGSPKFEKISGTTLYYAINTTTPVIQVDDHTWFACQNGAWFTAVSPAGPWVLAASVPAVIYTIPASSPLYYVTFVRVYGADATYVWIGYTPGYYGAIIGPDGTVVYGTGYVYPAYVGTTVYVSYPVTYGYATSPTWTPWAGWAFGFACGFAWGSSWDYWSYYPPAPYWGPYYNYCYGWGYNSHGGITAWGPYGWAGTSGDIYHTRGPWSSVSRVAGGYDGWTGNQWATQYGHAYNSTTGTRIAGQRGAVENVYTGNYAAGGRGIAHNDNTGVTAVGRHGTIGNENTGREISGGHGTVYNPNTGNTTHIAGAHGNEGNAVLDVNGNVYAGHDGHVYQRNDDGSWNQLTRPSQSQTSQSNANLGERRENIGERFGNDTGRESLERDRSARDLGASRSAGFQSTRPAPSGGFRGGNFRGGGGGGFHRR